MKYRCIYISGDGTEYEEGTFELQKKTKRFLILRMTEENYFANYPDIKIRKIPLEGTRGTKFCPAVIFWGDGSFTIYHNADGTPYIYNPLREARDTAEREVRIWHKPNPSWNKDLAIKRLGQEVLFSREKR